MKVSDLRRHEDVREGRVAKDRAYAVESDRLALAGAVSKDRAYAVESDRLALAGAVSVAVVQYRSERGLTQTAFAAEMGWKQPQVARLERGDVTPSWETLERLARAGVIEVHLGRQGTIVRELASA